MNIFKWFKNIFFYTGPYLENDNRLADILAAIQVLGTYEFAARELTSWTKRLGRKPSSAESWENIFNDHPKFFTLDDTNKIALVWRRSFKRDYDTVTKKVVPDDMRVELRMVEESSGVNRLSRQPLNQSQIEHLCNLAINLHEREIQHRQEKRWWMAAVVAVIIAIKSLYKG